jgi:hypothetical protein
VLPYQDPQQIHVTATQPSPNKQDMQLCTHRRSWVQQKKKTNWDAKAILFCVYLFIQVKTALFDCSKQKKSHFICNKATRASGPSLGRDEQAPPLCQITWLKSDKKPSLFLLNLSSSFCKIPRNWNTTQTTDEYNWNRIETILVEKSMSTHTTRNQRGKSYLFGLQKWHGWNQHSWASG